jgi:hypothetical protein
MPTIETRIMPTIGTSLLHNGFRKIAVLNYLINDKPSLLFP